jgi:hypothetical protein
MMFKYTSAALVTQGNTEPSLCALLIYLWQERASRLTKVERHASDKQPGLVDCSGASVTL